jgi:hypothetical protein
MWLQAIYQGTFGGHLRASLSQRGPVEAGYRPSAPVLRGAPGSMKTVECARRPLKWSRPPVGWGALTVGTEALWDKSHVGHVIPSQPSPYILRYILSFVYS